jgi:hypothetical protein
MPIVDAQVSDDDRSSNGRNVLSLYKTKRNLTMKQLVLAAVVACVTAPAFASDICAEHPKDQWMTEEAITAMATEKGYEVRKVKKEDGCWEVKGTKDGQRVEAYFDPVSGELVKTK